MIPVFVINLDGSDDRLTSATTQLDAAGLAFERVAAFDGRGKDLSSLPRYDAQAAMRYMGRDLRGGEVGCYMSHLDCAARVLATGAPHALVLEDDMLLAPDFAIHLTALVSWLDAQPALRWHLVNLGNNRLKIATQLHSFGPHELYHAHYFPMTTTALLWSREGAEAFLRDGARIFAPVDNFFRYWLTRSNLGLAFRPPLVTTTGAESDIDVTQGGRKTATRDWLYSVRKQRRLIGDKLIARRAQVLGRLRLI